MPGTKIRAGNFVLCMSILLSGSSASKVLPMFQHMGVACFSLKTFFKHQHVSYRGRILITLNRTLYYFYGNFGQNIQSWYSTLGIGQSDESFHSICFDRMDILVCF